AIPLLDVSLKLRGRQIVPRDSAPAKDQHELAPQVTFPASRFRHHGSQPYPPPGLIEPRHGRITACPGGTATAPASSLPKSPDLARPAPELKKATGMLPGVARQHAGITVQVENCQTVVFAAYVTATQSHDPRNRPCPAGRV